METFIIAYEVCGKHALYETNASSTKSAQDKLWGLLASTLLDEEWRSVEILSVTNKKDITRA